MQKTQEIVIKLREKEAYRFAQLAKDWGFTEVAMARHLIRTALRHMPKTLPQQKRPWSRPPDAALPRTPDNRKLANLHGWAQISRPDTAAQMLDWYERKNEFIWFSWASQFWYRAYLDPQIQKLCGQTKHPTLAAALSR